MALSPLLLLLLLISTTTIAAALSACSDRRPPPSGATELSIFHVNSHCTPFSPPTPPPPAGLDSIQSQAKKDPSRLAYLSSLVAAAPRPTKVPVASGQQITQTANYVLRAKLGTPGQLLFMALDTSADLSFVPCTNSSATDFSPAASSTFSPSNSSSPLCPLSPGSSGPCSYNQTYGTTTFTATLSQDSLRLALDVEPGYSFGCITAVSGATQMPKQGLLGLGRGAASLLSQTGGLYQGVFSYCLPSFKSYYFSGSLRLGPVGQPKKLLSTPLLRNPHRPSLYYVNMTGVSVGRVAVAAPAPAGAFGFDPATGAGTVVDSGTVITRLVAYEAVRDEFRRQVGAETYSSLGAFDTCFATGGEVETPAVTLHFEGMDLVLPAENTLIHSSSGPLACLAMAAAPANVNAVVNVIANLQQQNHRVLFDVANSRVGFARELCN